VLAEILLDAVLGRQPGEDARTAALRSARTRGEELGAATRADSRPGRLGPERSVTLAEAVLEQRGFEPDRPTPTDLRLLNCPFHPLAARSPELVCAINHAFLCGFLAGLRTNGVEAVLAPRPGRCCVGLRAASGGHGAPGSEGTCTREPGAPPTDDRPPPG
jgi:predicted ArsR family transcriptional regulator